MSAFNSTNVDAGLLDPTVVQSANRTLHGDINEDGVTNNSDCKVCHYNTTGMGQGYTVKLVVDTTTPAADLQNVSKYNTFYCTMCHFVNTTSTGVVKDEPADSVLGLIPSNAPKVNMHTPYATTRKYSDIGVNVRRPDRTYATFMGGRTPVCESCHNNSVYYYNASDSLVKRVAHYGKYYNLTTIGSLDQNTTRCAECHRGDANTLAPERSLWGVNDSEGPAGGFLGPGNPSGFDMFKTSNPASRNYCWTCHIAKNAPKTSSQAIDPPATNFHAAEIDSFMWNCQSCH
ncbi:MAG: hypothetical protein D6733_06440 [Methanobacteriota archaeon]|nr:MAG: hypothetical protein D6733_06440 [Euryarchaeota archaeon]